jgi:dUTP pyrophosphatase
MKVKRLSSESFLPTRGSEYSAGLDLYSPLDVIINPGQRVLIKLDISIEIPSYTYAHICARSGLSLKNGIHVGAGVIDSDYRGNVGVLLFNLSNEQFNIKKGDRIAQMIVKKYEHVDVEEVNDLNDSTRSSGGFGSTGS